jgi:uncharacterized SAM-binding protein YcdF (DUF218 family)
LELDVKADSPDGFDGAVWASGSSRRLVEARRIQKHSPSPSKLAADGGGGGRVVSPRMLDVEPAGIFVRRVVLGGRLGRVWLGAALVLFAAAAVAALVDSRATLTLVGSFLVVNDPLQNASSIVVLAGGTPARESEAAAVYRNGWATRVVLVGNANIDERRAVLVRSGVPAASIVVVAGHPSDTLAELRLAEGALNTDQQPVILVTSKFHTRRVRLAWQQASAGRQAPIVRAVQDDQFDPARWWRDAQMARVVVHEYLGLIRLAL